MGTWGVALYANDTALDVRDGWLAKLRLGTSGDEATAALLAEWGVAAQDDPIFWIALADTQWTWGRLEARVLERATAALAAGGDLALWEDSKEKGARGGCQISGGEAKGVVVGDRHRDRLAGIAESQAQGRGRLGLNCCWPP